MRIHLSLFGWVVSLWQNLFGYKGRHRAPEATPEQISEWNAQRHATGW